MWQIQTANNESHACKKPRKIVEIKKEALKEEKYTEYLLQRQTLIC